MHTLYLIIRRICISQLLDCAKHANLACRTSNSIEKKNKLCHHGTTTAKLQQTTYPKLPKNNVTSHAHQIL